MIEDSVISRKQKNLSWKTKLTYNSIDIWKIIVFVCEKVAGN